VENINLDIETPRAVHANQPESHPMCPMGSHLSVRGAGWKVMEKTGEREG
jgi:hypothetical protein